MLNNGGEICQDVGQSSIIARKDHTFPKKISVQFFEKFSQSQQTPQHPRQLISETAVSQST